MAHYLVTGGAGFIGSNLAHALVTRGEQVRVLDNFATGREENIAELVEKKKVELIRGSIADAEAVARAVRGRRLRSASGGDPVGAALDSRIRSAATTSTCTAR